VCKLSVRVRQCLDNAIVVLLVSHFHIHLWFDLPEGRPCSLIFMHFNLGFSIDIELYRASLE